MKMKLALAAAVSTFFVTAVQAQTFTPGFYAGAELGSAQVKDQSGNISSALVSSVGGTANASQDKNVFIGRIFGGYKIIENVDVELGYFQTNSYSLNFNGTSSGGTAYSGSANQKLSGFDYSVLLRPSISTGFNGAFLRLGGHYSKVKADVSVTGVTTAVASGNQNGSGFVAGLGYDFNVADNIDIRAEYMHLDNIGGSSSNSTDSIMIGVVGKF
ncbi:hypothetical protein D9O50_01090 [Oxalobacteraceae bacterium CAVE-383]|nr:hypothetical protein D9O50_01090 [Oxalobacteraceae bacterium CAVE-383]